MLTCLGVTATFTHSFPFHHPRTQDMVKGRPLSDDLRKVILNMARHFDVTLIHHYTGCATRSIERLLADWRKNSTIVRDLTARRRRGKRQILSGTNIRVHLTICLIFLSLYWLEIILDSGSQFLHGHLRHSPDIYIDEMKELLESRVGIEVDDSTIWRALRRSGFTMKKVNPHSR